MWRTSTLISPDRTMLVLSSWPVTGFRRQQVTFLWELVLRRRVIFMLNNLSVSCEWDMDVGGMISPSLSLHSIWGCGNQPPVLHSTKRPLVLGGCTRICIPKLVAGWKERGKTVFLLEEKEENRERKAYVPHSNPRFISYTDSQALWGSDCHHKQDKPGQRVMVYKLTTQGENACLFHLSIQKYYFFCNLLHLGDLAINMDIIMNINSQDLCPLEFIA